MKREPKIVLASALLCGVVGPLVGTVLAMVVLGNPDHMFTSLWDALAVFPKTYVFALIFTAPVSLLLGGLGGLFLILRLRRVRSVKRLRIEMATLGALLGSSYPLLARALGWNPFEGFPGILLIAVAVGALCALLVTVVVRNDLR